MQSYRLGSYFRNLKDELDLDENSHERVTQAGSLWRLAEIDGDKYHLTCAQTGGWIIPSLSEVREQFEPVLRIMASIQPQTWNGETYVSIDGRRDIDITKDILALRLFQIHGLKDDGDTLRVIVDVKNLGLSGHYAVHAKDNVEHFFEVENLQLVTLENLQAAQQRELLIENKEPEKGFVIYSESNGVFLGSELGVDHWSNINPFGNEKAIAFADEAHALLKMQTWKAIPDDIVLTPVALDFYRAATIASCVDAGLPSWSPGEIAMQNAIASTPVEAAIQFMEELLASVETLSGIADEHGSETLADLMYLQNAILTNSYIDNHPESSKVATVVASLPSAEHWAKFIQNTPEQSLTP